MGEICPVCGFEMSISRYCEDVGLTAIVNRMAKSLILASPHTRAYIWDVAGIVNDFGRYQILSTRRSKFDRTHVQIGWIFGDVNVKERWG